MSDYGFAKLIELFEAVPDTLAIIEENEEKIICLTELELVKVLEEQVTSLKQITAKPICLFSRFHCC